MNLINTNGLVIFGVGSEWFWSMAQFVVVLVTLFGIYRQLRIARSANAFEQMNNIANEWGSERNTRYRLDVLVALRDGTDPAHIPFGAAAALSDYWENVAALVRAGHVDRRLVYDSLSSDIPSWWDTLAPFQRRYRIETGDQKGGEHFEWLAGVIAEMDRKAGVSNPFDEALLASTLDTRIQSARDGIRVAEELRAVIVRPMSPTTASTPPMAAQETAPAAPLA